MQFDEFVDRFSQRAELDTFTAEALATAVFKALAEQVGTERMAEITVQPPKELRGTTVIATEPHALRLHEFYSRVRALAIATPDCLGYNVRAVLGTIDETVSSGRLDKLFTRLPPAYHALTAGWS